MIKPKRSHLLLLWCSLLLAGQAQSESVSVDFCIPDYADLMSMETANQFLQQAASQGVKVRFHDAKGEGRRQLEQLSKAKGETVFVIPTEDCDRQAMLDSARAKGQRLVYLNAPPESRDFKAYADLWYIGPGKGECARALSEVITGYLKANPWHDLDGDGQLKILYFKGPAKSQRAQELMDDLSTGPEFIETFDSDLFDALVDRIIVEDAEHISFQVKNGLRLREQVERMRR